MEKKNTIHLENYMPRVLTLYKKNYESDLDDEDNIMKDDMDAFKQKYRSYNQYTFEKETRREEKTPFERKEEIRKSKPQESFVLSLMLFLMMLASICYVFYAIFFGKNQINQTEVIIQSVFLLLFSISVAASYKLREKKSGFKIASTFIFTLFLCFSLLTKLEILKLPSNSVMQDFTNVSIQKALAWAEANHINVEQVYDDSDTTQEYNIIKQSVYPNVLVSSIKTVEFTVSSGPDYNKETVIPDMTGWNIDEAIAFMDENFLNNVIVDFEISEEAPKDTIIYQSHKGNMKRNDEICFRVSLGSELSEEDITMEDLENLTVFKATLWLKRNRIPYAIEREFSDKVKRRNIIRQDVKKGTKINRDTRVTLVMSKGKKVTVPDLLKMDQKEITKWIVENKLKIEFSDRYDEKVKKGKVIEVSHKKGENIEEGTTVKIVISKGILKFPKFSSLNEFRLWANRYGIAFTEEYEQSKEIKQGEIIRFSVKDGDTVNPNENIVVTISSGDVIVVPNFIGKKKVDIEKSCQSLSLNCTFYYAGNSDKERDIALSQNKRAGSEVVKDTYVNIGLSSGKRANNPNINTGSTGGGSGSTPSPTPTPQPVCNTKTFQIQPTWIIINDPQATCNNIKNGNPGYSFSCNFMASDSGRKGQLLNANQLKGTTINSCNTVVLNIKNN